MKTLQEIMAANYEAVKGRGLIDDETTLPEFITKLQEEIGELIKAKDEAEAAAELADIVGVCLNIASHYGIDLPAELGVMVRRNEVRAQKNTFWVDNEVCKIGRVYTLVIRGDVLEKINHAIYNYNPVTFLPAEKYGAMFVHSSRVEQGYIIVDAVKISES